MFLTCACVSLPQDLVYSDFEIMYVLNLEILYDLPLNSYKIVLLNSCNDLGLPYILEILDLMSSPWAPVYPYPEFLYVLTIEFLYVLTLSSTCLYIEFLFVLTFSSCMSLCSFLLTLSSSISLSCSLLISSTLFIRNSSNSSILPPLLSASF